MAYVVALSVALRIGQHAFDPGNETVCGGRPLPG
jgi:hypothetical protein